MYSRICTSTCSNYFELRCFRFLLHGNTDHRTDAKSLLLMTATPMQVPMTSAAARFAVEPPPPVIKQKQEQPAPKPAEKKAEQIFTF